MSRSQPAQGPAKANIAGTGPSALLTRRAPAVARANSSAGARMLSVRTGPGNTFRYARMRLVRPSAYAAHAARNAFQACVSPQANHRTGTDASQASHHALPSP